jgi:antirestriction protein ArdC
MSWKSARRETTERRDPMQELCEAVIAELEKGVKPWVRPWDPLKCAGPHAPFNMATGHRYSGVNVIALGLRTAIFGSDDPRFCTYNQAQEHHWQVKKGEHGSTVFLYKPLDRGRKGGRRQEDCSASADLHSLPCLADDGRSAMDPAEGRGMPMAERRGHGDDYQEQRRCGTCWW